MVYLRQFRQQRWLHMMHYYFDRVAEEYTIYTYDPFWKTLNKSGITTYALIYHYGILPNAIQRIRDKKNVTVKTIDDLCSALSCSFSDIVEHVPEDK